MAALYENEEECPKPHIGFLRIDGGIGKGMAYAKLGSIDDPRATPLTVRYDGETEELAVLTSADATAEGTLYLGADSNFYRNTEIAQDISIDWNMDAVLYEGAPFYTHKETIIDGKLELNDNH